jgi:hypothetical protein
MHPLLLRHANQSFGNVTAARQGLTKENRLLLQSMQQV